LNQAIRDANDGIGLLQTAEGAMVEVTNMMQRMRELSIQAANDTNAQDDRNYLDLEFQQLKQEINRITKNTQWNGMNILDQTEPASGARGGTFTFQVGANTGEQHKINHTLDKLAFGDADGGVTVGTDTTNDIQTDTFTFDDAFLAGDVITLTVNNAQFQYTDTAEDADAADVDEAVAASIRAALGAEFASLTVAGATNTVTFAGVADQEFDSFEKVTNGQLASLSELLITNQANTDLAVAALDRALTTVNEARAEIGAVINRLTYAADNLANVSMNTSESRSRILDTDYAKASAELARTQIISQAATAMLAQANQQPQAVLQLLQG
jgi:flagellin